VEVNGKVVPLEMRLDSSGVGYIVGSDKGYKSNISDAVDFARSANPLKYFLLIIIN
jgi:hypothetical protein